MLSRKLSVLSLILISSLTVVGCQKNLTKEYKSDKNVKKVVDSFDNTKVYNGVDYKYVLNNNSVFDFSDGYLTYQVKNGNYKDGVLKFTVSVIADKYDISNSALPNVTTIFDNESVVFDVNANRNLFALNKGDYFDLEYSAKVKDVGTLEFMTNSFKFKFDYNFHK